MKGWGSGWAVGGGGCGGVEGGGGCQHSPGNPALVGLVKRQTFHGSKSLRGKSLIWLLVSAARLPLRLARLPLRRGGVSDTSVPSRLVMRNNHFLK